MARKSAPTPKANRTLKLPSGKRNPDNSKAGVTPQNANWRKVYNSTAKRGTAHPALKGTRDLQSDPQSKGTRIPNQAGKGPSPLSGW